MRSIRIKYKSYGFAAMKTSGQSNSTYGRIAAAHGRYSRIHQVARMCTP